MNDSFMGAKWIWLPHEPEATFYRAIFCQQVKASQSVTISRLRVRMTADALYQLWINGQWIGHGPARGDATHYRFEEYEAEIPHEAVTIVAAVIPPNRWLATGEVHLQAGLLLSGEILDETGGIIERLETDSTWQCAVDPAFDRNECDDANWQRTPMGAVGYGELIDFRQGTDFAARGLEAPLQWTRASEIIDLTGEDGRAARTLEPSPLPPAERRLEDLGTWFQPGVGEVTLPVEVGPEAASWFVDHGALTTGYPELVFQGGQNRRVRLYYAEALRNGSDENWLQADGKAGAWAARCHERDHATSQTDVPPMAYFDEVILTKGESKYRPSYLRTFRFLKIDFEAGEPVTLVRTDHIFSAYPFEQKARFECSDPSLQPIVEAAFRTMRLCAHDHFEDCPYFERLQYAGDTGLQAWLSYLVTGDLRLGDQAIRQFAWSQAPADPRMVQTRYPANTPQVIPIFGLFWVHMAEDWLRFSHDLTPVIQAAPRMAEVIEWFDEQETGGFIPDKSSNFVDWAWGHCLQGFRMPRSPEGFSAIVNLQAAWCLTSAEKTFRKVSRPSDADLTLDLANRLKAGVKDRCVDLADGLIVDGPSLSSKSQHGQIWAILTDLVEEPWQHRLLDAILSNDDQLVRSSLYHDYFLFRAADKLGRYDQVWPMVQQWRDLIAKGYTTFPEEDGRHGFIRSECHAWTAWILGDFFTQILGIQVLAPDQVEVRPQPGGLAWARGCVPLGGGFVNVDWRIAEGVCQIDATFPEGVEGKVIAPNLRRD